MQERRCKTVQEIVCTPELRIVLAGKSDDHVDTDEGIGHRLPYAGDPLGILGRRITPPHQTENPVRTALERYMEVMLKLGRGRAECYDLVGQQIRLYARYPVSFDALHCVQCAQQLDETLARRTSEIARIDTRDDDLPLSAGRYLARLRDYIGNRYVAAPATRIVYRAVRALVVAAVLNLQEGTCAVAARKGSEEARQVLDVTARHDAAAPGQQLYHPFIYIALIVVAKHYIHTIYRRDLVRFELCVTPRYRDHGIGVAPMNLAYYIAALLVGMLRYRAAVYNGDIGGGIRCDTHEAALVELAGNGRRLGKVEFAAQRMKIDSLMLHVISSRRCGIRFIIGRS